MPRLALLICGTLLLAFGCLLFIFGFAKLGINDAEWGHISRTGLPSAPDKLQWSSWQQNDGSVYPFSSFQPEQRPDSLPEFRVGRGHTMFFDYVFYQGRFVRGGVTHEFPALGPASGAVYPEAGGPSVLLALSILAASVAELESVRRLRPHR